jgi:ubiquinone/menaquinone biosynthesis C-methylase UbiE
LNNQETTKNVWNIHYTKDKSKLSYPDENLVRMLAGIKLSGNALDYGAGSGRHCALLQNYGYRVTAADFSENSISIIKQTYPDVNTYHIQSASLPFMDRSFSVVVNWGVLHYNSFDESLALLKEFQRVTAPGGYILGSIRSDKDTYLKASGGKVGVSDIQGASIRLYSLEDVNRLLSVFSEYKIGYMERTVLGNLEEKICHWTYLAKV